MAAAEPTRPRTYLPAAGHDWFLPLYDPFVKLLGGDRVRRSLVEQADLRPGARVLEIGCGTGSVLLVLKARHPDARIVGLDPDPKALARARRKAEIAGVSLELDRGFSDQLPYPDGCFDAVFSSLMFHHLPIKEKAPTLTEVRRVLAPGSSFHMVDLAGVDPASSGLWSHLAPWHRHARENSPDRVLDLMRQAGLENPRQVAARRMLFGRVVYYRAARRR